jgi:hypothetical protein
MQDIRALAIRYIDEVIRDQQDLGYSGAVSPAAREDAIADAEAALEELAATSTRSTKVAAA